MTDIQTPFDGEEENNIQPVYCRITENLPVVPSPKIWAVEAERFARDKSGLDRMKEQRLLPSSPPLGSSWARPLRPPPAPAELLKSQSPVPWWSDNSSEEAVNVYTQRYNTAAFRETLSVCARTDLCSFMFPIHNGTNTCLIKHPSGIFSASL